MITHKIKLTNSETGRLTAQDPRANVGESKRVTTYAITAPDDVTMSDVLGAANACCFFGPGCAFDFAELVPGRIIRS